MINVSVIIPAYNALATLAETVESLLAQSFPHWEALIVDDGSDDDTVAVAESFAGRDTRIRVIRQAHQGVSAARNTGIDQARYEWLLFLDADDWLLPRHLEHLTGKLVTNSQLDGAYCWYCRVAADGTFVEEDQYRQEGDLFPIFARRCIFAIHTCVIRRALVMEVGGFDLSLDQCEDWDLWQRIARTGAQFGVVCEVLAHYRMRPKSLSVDGFRMLTGLLRMMHQGESSDPRVPNPAPAYASGLPESCPPEIQFFAACWAAGMLLGQGQDARPLLRLLKEVHASDLNPSDVAKTIFRTTLFPSSRAPASWLELWPAIETHVREFLRALETQAQAVGLARRTQMCLERMIVECSDAWKPVTVGAFHAICLEVTEPIPDVSLAATIERLHCTVMLRRERLGAVELPVCDGRVPSAVLADAIVADFNWPILGAFFGATLYPTFEVKRETAGLSIWRGSQCLAEGLPDTEQPIHSQIHEHCGWTVFLQELWAHPDWSSERFYDPQGELEARPRRWVSDGWLVIEAAQEISDVETSAPVLNVVLTVGGAAIGVVVIPVRDQFVSAQEIRENLISASALELCRAAVREGVLGKPLAEPTTLRTRLAKAASMRGGFEGSRHGEAVSLLLSKRGAPHGVVRAPSPAPGATWGLNQTLEINSLMLVLGRRDPTIMDTSASRWAVFPAASAPVLLAAASVTGEPALLISPAGEPPEQIVYRPDLIWKSLRRPPKAVSSRKAGARSAGTTKDSNRAHFERFFAGQVDPWKYTSPYEQMKYEQTLSLLPEGSMAHALELACAEGHFTVQLAPRVEHLTATDISQLALERAAERCAHWRNVSFQRLDFMEEPLLGRFSLIVCSEVLYYVGGRPELQAVAEKLSDALEPGGYLLMAHANVVVDEPDQAGFDWDNQFGAKTIEETFVALDSLQLRKVLRTPLYRIHLFQRVSASSLAALAPEQITLSVQPTSLLPEVAAQVLWKGGTVRPSSPQPVMTTKLPILMYHRVSPTGALATSRYRVTPEAFAEQLQYLSNAGYYSVSLEEWRLAKGEKKPLPGRAILITFDDGYQDFLSYAWPLLKQYGFLATVFLVTDAIGGTNTWDAFYGETLPLLSWSEIQQLQKEGVEFGSHSAGHRHLTALTPAEIVYEGMRSRATLENVFGTPVRAFAYPYGDTDPVVQHLIGACGYSFGISCKPGLSQMQDSLLVLPRIEVKGTDGLCEFVVQLDP